MKTFLRVEIAVIAFLLMVISALLFFWGDIVAPNRERITELTLSQIRAGAEYVDIKLPFMESPFEAKRVKALSTVFGENKEDFAIAVAGTLSVGEREIPLFRGTEIKGLGVGGGVVMDGKLYDESYALLIVAVDTPLVNGRRFDELFIGDRATYLSTDGGGVNYTLKEIGTVSKDNIMSELENTPEGDWLILVVAGKDKSGESFEIYKFISD